MSTDLDRPVVDGFLRNLNEARGGSREALGRLLEVAHPYLLQLARKMQQSRISLRAKADASDWVQETLKEAVEDFPHFAGASEGEWRAWLRRILIHNQKDAIRRYYDVAARQLARERPLREPSEQLADSHGSPEQELLGPDWGEQFEDLLLLLPPRYREALRLRFSEGLSHSEIGQRIGTTPAAAQRLCSRAIERLRRELNCQI